MASKELYFAALYALRDSSDDEEVPKDVPLPLKSRKAAKQSIKPVIDAPPALLHSVSAPVQGSPQVIRDTPVIRKDAPAVECTPLREDPSIISETPVNIQAQKLRPHAQKRALSSPGASTAPVSTDTTMAGPAKKRRKQEKLNLVPEARRVFKDCMIYWIPNNDTDPARRMRIRKAREHGAIWTQTFTSDVTYIMVDSHIEYKHVLSHLNVPSIPPGQLVNDRYRVDCINFSKRLDPDQRCYHVKGYERKNIEARSSPITMRPPRPPIATSNSLELKAPQKKPGKWDYVPPKATPPRSEESTQVDHAARHSIDSSPGVFLPGVQSDKADIASPEARRQSGEMDDFDRLMLEQKAAADLPLDDEDEGTVVNENDSGNDTDEPPTKTASKRPKSKVAFSCMTGGNGEATGLTPNDAIIEKLLEMADYYDRMKDHWRPRAYRRACTELRRQPTKIKTFEEASAIPFVGERLAHKIVEISTTSRLRRLENTQSEPEDEALQTFTNIYGVGISQASKWAAQGHRTVRDLLENISLTDNQRIGIAHYNDFLQRIPRAEVTALGHMITKTAAEIDPCIEIIIGGSYRRGAKSSGDIDCIITKKGTSKSSEIIDFLNALVKRLTKEAFLVAALATPSTLEGTKWHGCCVLPSSQRPNPHPWRRIDLLLVPASEIGAALIYFTGNDIFNRSIRLWASRLGMRLNQRGLYKNVLRGKNRVKVCEGELVEGEDERRIFEILGVPWREPWDRIC